MKVYLIHHANALSAEQDHGRHLSELGREQADRIGARLKAAGATPLRILHSDKQWTTETAERVAAVIDASDKTELAGYPCNTGDSIEPFIKDIINSPGDIMMAGHFNFLVQTASRLVCGDKDTPIVAFKPGNGTTFCLEGAGNDWVVAFGWRPEHAPL
ncbi:histidine phosphatase family protein [Alphaproteobacteria bacterium]|nr:histidine phosphatase family protein [Alphaproteobacteria bacterium]